MIELYRTRPILIDISTLYIYHADVNMEEIMIGYGKSIFYFNFVEHELKSFICRHYFKRRNDKFLEEVLEDKYVNFFLVHHLFLKILKKYYPDAENSFPKKELEELNKLRNLITHAVLGGSIVNASSIKPHFSHGGTIKSIKKTFARFESLREVIDPALTSLHTLDSP